MLGILIGLDRTNGTFDIVQDLLLRALHMFKVPVESIDDAKKPSNPISRQGSSKMNSINLITTY
jgi:hypothetical protein